MKYQEGENLRWCSSIFGDVEIEYKRNCLTTHEGSLQCNEWDGYRNLLSSADWWSNVLNILVKGEDFNTPPPSFQGRGRRGCQACVRLPWPVI